MARASEELTLQLPGVPVERRANGSLSGVGGRVLYEYPDIFGELPTEPEVQLAECWLGELGLLCDFSGLVLTIAQAYLPHQDWRADWSAGSPPSVVPGESFAIQHPFALTSFLLSLACRLETHVDLSAHSICTRIAGAPEASHCVEVHGGLLLGASVVEGRYYLNEVQCRRVVVNPTEYRKPRPW
jgi:hypothetical protein